MRWTLSHETTTTFNNVCCLFVCLSWCEKERKDGEKKWGTRMEIAANRMITSIITYISPAAPWLLAVVALSAWTPQQQQSRTQPRTQQPQQKTTKTTTKGANSRTTMTRGTTCCCRRRRGAKRVGSWRTDFRRWSKPAEYKPPTHCWSWHVCLE